MDLSLRAFKLVKKNGVKILRHWVSHSKIGLKKQRFDEKSLAQLEGVRSR